MFFCIWLYLVEKIHKFLLSFFLFFRASCLVIFATSLNLLLTCWLSCHKLSNNWHTQYFFYKNHLHQSTFSLFVMLLLLQSPISAIWDEVANMTRQKARKNKKKDNRNLCIFSTKHNPRGPDIRKIKKNIIKKLFVTMKRPWRFYRRVLFV